MDFIAMRAEAIHKFGINPTGRWDVEPITSKVFKHRRRPLRRLKAFFTYHRLMMYDWSKCLCAHKRRAKIYLRWRGEYHAK